MMTALIPALGALIGKVVDRAIPDRDKAEELKAQMTLALIQEGNAELQGAVSIIQAEAQGESWMQRNWRPVLMLTIVAIVANNYLVAPYLSAMGLHAPMLALPERLWDLMTLGVGGYIGGRSIEKAVSAWKGGA